MADDPIGVLARITAIFEAIGDDDSGIGVSELALRAGLPKSTVSRLVSGLVHRHYLERDGTSIRLGLRLFELGQLAERPQALRRAALPVISALRTETGQSVELSIRDGADMVRIAVVRGRSAAAGQAGQAGQAGHLGQAGQLGPVGERTPARSTPQGRSVLARQTMTETVSGASTDAAAVLVSAPVLCARAGIEGAVSIALPDEQAARETAAAVETAAAEIVRRLTC